MPASTLVGKAPVARVSAPMTPAKGCVSTNRKQAARTSSCEALGAGTTGTASNACSSSARQANTISRTR